MFTSGGVSAGVLAVWFWFAVVGPLDWATWLPPSTVTSSSPGMEDSYSQRDNIWNRISRHTSQEGKLFKAANKRTQEPTLASRMDRVVSICCMRRDMLASFCRKEIKMLDILMSLCDSAGATDKKKNGENMQKRDAQTSSQTMEKRLRNRTVCTTNWLR